MHSKYKLNLLALQRNLSSIDLENLIKQFVFSIFILFLASFVLEASCSFVKTVYLDLLNGVIILGPKFLDVINPRSAFKVTFFIEYFLEIFSNAAISLVLTLVNTLYCKIIFVNSSIIIRTLMLYFLLNPEKYLKRFFLVY